MCVSLCSVVHLSLLYPTPSIFHCSIFVFPVSIRNINYFIFLGQNAAQRCYFHFVSLSITKQRSLVLVSLIVNKFVSMQ